jgi:hypothetical protein
LPDAASQRGKDRAGLAGRTGGGRLRHDQRNAADAATATVAALAEQWLVLAVRQHVVVVGRADRAGVGQPIVAIVRWTVVLDGRAAVDVRRVDRIVEWFDTGGARAATLADPAVGCEPVLDRIGNGLGFAVGRAGRPGRAVHRICRIYRIYWIHSIHSSHRIDRIRGSDGFDRDGRHVGQQCWLEQQGQVRQRGRYGQYRDGCRHQGWIGRIGCRATVRRGPARADRPPLRRDLRGVRRAHAQGTGSRVAGAGGARQRIRQRRG